VIKVAFPTFHSVSKKFRYSTIKHGLANCLTWQDT